MSDYRYALDIYAKDTASLDAAKAYLEVEGITPHIMKVDLENRNQAAGESYLYLSTDSFIPYGSVKCWETQDHESFFHTLSKHVPNAKFVFSGEDLDDPNGSRFLKAFLNGQFKDAYLDVLDLGTILENMPWREYGTPAIEPPIQKNNQVPVVILTCAHQTKFGDYLYSSIHPNAEAALEHIPNVKEACNFEPELDEFFSYDIDYQVLNLETMTSRQKSAHAIDELLANAEKRAGQPSAPGRSPNIDSPLRR